MSKNPRQKKKNIALHDGTCLNATLQKFDKKYSRCSSEARSFDVKCELGMLLVGDIGGSKTVLAVVSKDSGPRHPLAEMTFPSAQYSSLEAVVKEFLKSSPFPVKRAVFGVAGPVVEGRSSLTNLPWSLNEHEVAKGFGLTSVRLLNDLEAIAHAVPFLEKSELHTLHEGKSVRKGNIAVVAPGTGLGEAFLTWDGARYQVHSSEGGHTDLAPRNEFEMGLLSYLMGQYSHVSYERVCSGPGIANIYEFLKQTGAAVEPSWLTERLADKEDPTPDIVNAASDRENPCELCSKTLDQFVSFVGAEAANCALKFMATQGVYLGGGIPPRIIPFFEKEIFKKSFLSKGRYTGFMERVPVHIILNTKAPLLGAACSELMNE